MLGSSMTDRNDRAANGPRQIAALLPKPPKPTKAVTPAQRRLASVAVHIHDNPPSRDDQAYMARQLVQATLPYSDPGQVPTWSRRNGYYTLSIQPGYDADNACIGYPYGAVPRLMLFWITREALIAKKNGDGRRIHLGRSLSQFMLDIGMAAQTSRTRMNSAARRGRRSARSKLSIPASTSATTPPALPFPKPPIPPSHRATPNFSSHPQNASNRYTLVCQVLNPAASVQSDLFSDSENFCP